MSEEQDTYALLPLRDIVVFPQMVVPLFVGRDMSIRALEDAVNKNKKLLLCAQTDQETDLPGPDEIHDTGVLASVLQFLKIPQGTIKVLVQGHERVKISEWLMHDQYMEVRVDPVPDTVKNVDKANAYSKMLKKRFGKYISAKKTLPAEIVEAVEKEDDPSFLADLVAGSLSADMAVKQELLETIDVTERMKKLLNLLQTEMSEMDIVRELRNRVKSQMERSHREHFLTEQMKAIQKELGESEDISETEEFERKINETNLTEEARAKALSELKKIRTTNPNSPEVQVSRNYLEWLLDIPWGTKKEIQSEIGVAQEILDNDHYGLKTVKERIIEFIAVQKRTGNVGGTILCLVGPPGVGKTSLGESVANATGREFVRIALGGIHDESEIRGHRRTYIGAMPGRIIKSFRKRTSVNPLILLDEVDKMSNFRGDPASAMLEVLDPEQNGRFYDNYLDVDYDLSEVLFITTANYLHDIPEPLRDRMEIIQLDGYTEDEKLQIAKRHLVPELISANGLKRSEYRMSDRVVEEIIRIYTREAGVRNLKREIGRLMRKAVTRIEREKVNHISVKLSNLEGFLGMPKYRYGLAQKEDQPGVATGLAWTQTGGDLLSIEAALLPGKGGMKTTGTLGSVMKESIAAASTYVKSVSLDMGIDPKRYETVDIHVHVPEGATPKEGPSAGIGMVTSIVSVLTSIPVKRHVAMTGEVTLRGNVLPIGGLKAKLLAAIRGGITTVLIPEKNKRDLSEIPDKIKDQLTIVPVKHVSEVLNIALASKPVPMVEIESIPPHPMIHPESGQSIAKH